MKRILVLLLVVLIAGCAPSEPDPLVIESKVKATVLAIPSQTPFPTYTPYPTYTPFPTPTKILPTSTLVPTPTLSSNPSGIVGVAKNSLGMIENSNVQLEIYRVIVADRRQYDFSKWVQTDSFKNALSMIELVVKYTNNTDALIKIHSFPDGIAAINGEQINFSNYYYETRFDDNTFSGLLPGMSITTGFWFPVKNTAWQEIKEIKLYIPGAINKNNFTFTDDFEFTISVEGWGFEAKQP